MNWLLRNKERSIEEKKVNEKVEHQISVYAFELMRDEKMNVYAIVAVKDSCGIMQRHSKLIESFSVSKDVR